VNESKITLLISAKHNAAVKLYKAIDTRYKYGSHIEWTRCGRQTGTVIKTSQDRLKVKNNKNGNEYWITIYDVLL
jgi:hypothetical protein